MSECTKESCPEMKLSKESYRCNAHYNGVIKDCCAIDYIVHNIDDIMDEILKSNRINITAEYLLNYKKYFTRIYRMFCHIYNEHKNIYTSFENETFLCTRFVNFCIQNNYMSTSDLKFNITII